MIQHLIQPKEIIVKTQDGDEKAFIISKFPATVGREIFCKYPLSGLPKIGDYAVNEETMLKLMAHVCVRTDTGLDTPLKTLTLVNNHVPDWETLAKIEWAMLEYNGSFFGSGKVSGYLDWLIARVQELTSKTSMVLSGQFSRAEKQPSTN